MNGLLILEEVEGLLVLGEAGLEASGLGVGGATTAEVETIATVFVRHLREFVPCELLVRLQVCLVAKVSILDALGDDGFVRV